MDVEKKKCEPMRFRYFVLVVLIVYMPVAMLDYGYFPYSDGAEHCAAVRELANNLRSPGDPMLVGDYPGSPRYTPSILLMSLFQKTCGIDVLLNIKIFLIVFFLFFLLSVFLFTREYFNDAGQPLSSLSCMLFLCWSCIQEPNAYAFFSLLHNSYYPSVVSFSLSLSSLYCLLKYFNSKRGLWFVIQATMGSIAFVNHPVTGCFYFISTFLITAERKGFSKALVLVPAVSLLTAVALVALWPYYNFFSSATAIVTGKMAGTADYFISWKDLHNPHLLLFGIPLFALPLVALYTVQRRHLYLYGSCLAFLIVYSGGYFMRLNLSERFIFFIAFTLHVTFSRFLRQWAASPDNLKKMLSKAMAILVLSGGITQGYFVCREYIWPAFTVEEGKWLPSYVSPNHAQLKLHNYFSRGDIVLSDLYSSWSIPVYTDAKIVCLFHTPPHIHDNKERIADVMKFYKPETGNPERLVILKKYNVTHVYLNYAITGKEIKSQVEALGLTAMANSNTFEIFSVKRFAGT
jgi:hypothetical protein